MNLLHAAIVVAEDTHFDPDSVTPGPWGFIFTAAVAVAVLLLGFNLVRRLRRSQYRHEIRAELEAELAARDGEAGSGDAAAPEQPGGDEPGQTRG